MGMYNMVNGVNEMAPVLLAMLKLHPAAAPRFRDCWWNGEHIVVYTRTGGGNRAYYESEVSCRMHYPSHFDGSRPFPHGPWNEDLRQLPTFVRDEDDDFDSTYALFYFTVPENLQWAVPQLVVQKKTTRERFEEFLEKLKDPNHPEAERVMQRMQPLMQQLVDFMKKEQP